MKTSTVLFDDDWSVQFGSPEQTLATVNAKDLKSGVVYSKITIPGVRDAIEFRLVAVEPATGVVTTVATFPRDGGATLTSRTVAALPDLTYELRLRATAINPDSGNPPYEGSATVVLTAEDGGVPVVVLGPC